MTEQGAAARRIGRRLARELANSTRDVKDRPLEGDPYGAEELVTGAPGLERRAVRGDPGGTGSGACFGVVAIEAVGRGPRQGCSAPELDRTLGERMRDSLELTNGAAELHTIFGIVD